MSKQELNFLKGKGLIPAIIQDAKTLELLMLGFVNRESFERTKKTGVVWFWSRSKKRLWMKGETSGCRLLVKECFIDCDSDSLLIKVNAFGKPVCHTGNRSCFQIYEFK